MKIHFRPLPGFTLLTLVLFSVLVLLGIWQLERLQWKLGLIHEIEHNLRAPPMPVQEALDRPANSVQYRRVEFVGTYFNDRESYVFATDKKGSAVYRVLTPVRLQNGNVLMVDRGVVPPALRDPAMRESGELTGARKIMGVLRTPDGPGYFTPQPDLGRRIWYARDLGTIAATLHLKLLSPLLVEADATPNPGGWPKGGQTVVALPNNHLQYAITWFLLAAALVVVYFAYHRARGRILILRR